MRGMLRNLSAKGAGPARAPAAAKPVTGIDDEQRLAMLDAFEEEDIGWFWATDHENRLIYLSPSASRRFPEDRQIFGQSLAALSNDGMLLSTALEVPALPQSPDVCETTFGLPLPVLTIVVRCMHTPFGVIVDTMEYSVMPFGMFRRSASNT